MAELGRPSPWLLTPDEKKQSILAVAQAIASFVGPVGPLIPLAVSYVYERRHILFNQDVTPVRAVNLEGRVLQLSGSRQLNAARLLTRAIPGREVVSFSATLTKSARDVGIREGDPVSVLLTSNSSPTTRSGLIIPTQVGARVDLVVPKNAYSLGALGSGRHELFSKRDPFAVIGGRSLALGAASEFELPLTARDKVVAQPPPSRCLSCNETLPPANMIWCPKCLARPPFRRTISRGGSLPPVKSKRIIDLAFGTAGIAPRNASNPATSRSVLPDVAPRPSLPIKPTLTPYPASPAPVAKRDYSPSDNQCGARNNKGGRCTGSVQANGLCNIHRYRALAGQNVSWHATGRSVPQTPIPADFYPPNDQCTARNRKGQRCGNYPNKYGLCWVHLEMVDNRSEVVWAMTGKPIRLA